MSILTGASCLANEATPEECFEQTKCFLFPASYLQFPVNISKKLTLNFTKKTSKMTFVNKNTLKSLNILKNTFQILKK